VAVLVQMPDGNASLTVACSSMLSDSVRLSTVARVWPVPHDSASVGTGAGKTGLAVMSLDKARSE